MGRFYNPAIGTATGFDTEQPIGPLVPKTDLPNVSQVTSIHQSYGQLATYYVAPAQNGTTLYGGTTFYLNEDTGHRAIGGGIIEWEREWAAIPSSWNDPQSTSFPYPSYTAGAAGSAKNVNGVTASGATTIFSLSVSGDAVAGDQVFWSVAYTRNGIATATAGTGLAVATTNTSQVTVTLTLPGSGSFTSISGSVSKFVTGVLAARSLVVGGRLAYDYALSTVASLNTDLPLTPIFQPITSAGLVTVDLTSTTTPSDATYRGWVVAGTEIVANCVRRRFKGNVFERQTTFVPAM